MQLDAPSATLVAEHDESALQIFPHASDFTIQGGSFTNVRGGMHIHNYPARPDGAQGSTPAQIGAERAYSESQLYTKTLIGFGRGYPLLMPTPRKNLPPEYRRHGVSIGDVGRVSPRGDFDFFFNVYLPANHPINLDSVPEGFSPLAPYGTRDFVESELKRGSLASASVQTECPDSNAMDVELQFHCRGPNGAFLALPRGSTLRTLENVETLRRYAATNAESWYRYVNEIRGRRLVNGGLYLITSWEKAPTGGMATFQNVAPDRDIGVALVPLVKPDGSVEYAFSRGDPIRAHTFATSDGVLNNAVFLNGFSISLGLGIIKRLLGNRVMFSQIGDKPGLEEYIPFSDSEGSFLSLSVGVLAGYGAVAAGHAAFKATETKLSDIAQTPEVLHPSRKINAHLVCAMPDASVVITHDNDWADTLRRKPDALDAPEFVPDLLKECDIRLDDGIVSLQRKPAELVVNLLNERQREPTTESVDVTQLESGLHPPSSSSQLPGLGYDGGQSSLGASSDLPQLDYSVWPEGASSSFRFLDLPWPYESDSVPFCGTEDINAPSGSSSDVPSSLNDMNWDVSPFQNILEAPSDGSTSELPDMNVYPLWQGSSASSSYLFPETLDPPDAYAYLPSDYAFSGAVTRRYSDIDTSRNPQLSLQDNAGWEFLVSPTDLLEPTSLIGGEVLFSTPTADFNSASTSSLYSLAPNPNPRIPSASGQRRHRLLSPMSRCPIPGCGRSCSSKFALKKHLRSHEKRPFLCKWLGCEKTFKHQYDRKRHEQLHADSNRAMEARMATDGAGRFGDMDTLGANLTTAEDGGDEDQLQAERALEPDAQQSIAIGEAVPCQSEDMGHPQGSVAYARPSL
ncbi:Pleiotropic drug resistance ABC transporter protein [Mycena kentingensis (nom. inval.)]|nr:Pleiotropic drug resistance ABC transporter protein [Mycena kentingensis (nom. inval.)]